MRIFYSQHTTALGLERLECLIPLWQSMSLCRLYQINATLQTAYKERVDLQRADQPVLVFSWNRTTLNQHVKLKLSPATKTIELIDSH